VKIMDTNGMKQCPYCAELILEDAVICRHCKSSLVDRAGTGTSREGRPIWGRVNEGKRIAGVCTGLAREFKASRLILPLRLFFILTTVFWGFGLILYIALWLLMPAPVDGGVRRSEPEKEEVTEQTARPAMDKRPPRKTGLFNVLAGVCIIFIGAVLTLAAVMQLPVFSIGWRPDMMMPSVLRDMFYFNINWITGILPLIVILGLLVMFFGAVQLISRAIGCFMVFAGIVLMLLFIPILPKILLFPGLLIIGIFLVLSGGGAIIAGTVGDRERPVPTVTPEPVSDESDNGIDWEEPQ